MRGKFFLVLLTLLAIITVVVLSYRENGVKTSPSYKTSSMRDFRLTHTENNEVRWELMAEEATFPEGEQKVLLDTLTMKVHHDRELALRGKSGVYDIKGKTLVINKPIEIDIEGAKLTTGSLVWNGRKGILTSREPIRLEEENFTIEGTGLSADVKSQRIRILKNVKGIFYN
ncbi:LPS export ABC transporter periplasmic protein LptC [bacterium]|nr:MAG: LPS export ABC transporter periplasmic protein LptC [bacterium]